MSYNVFMPRLVKKTAKGPMVVGDKLYWYVNGLAEEIVTESDENCHHGGESCSHDGEEGCCGGQYQH